MFDAGVLKGFSLYHEEIPRAGNDDSHALVSLKRSHPRGLHSMFRQCSMSINAVRPGAALHIDKTLRFNVILKEYKF